MRTLDQILSIVIIAILSVTCWRVVILHREVAELTKDVDALCVNSPKFQDMTKAELRGIRAEMGEIKELKQVNEEFDRIDKRIDSLNGRIIEHAQDVAEVETRLKLLIPLEDVTTEEEKKEEKAPAKKTPKGRGGSGGYPGSYTYP